METHETKTIPGPGAYDIVPAISSKGEQFYSKYESSRAALFHPAHSQRFLELRTLFVHTAL